MADLLSPGVKVTREDMSQVVAVEGDSAAVFGGDFEKGPVGVHTLISSVQELRDNYGYPTTKNYNQYYQVQNFLSYSGAIYVSRAADINGTPTILNDVTFNENAYKTDVEATLIDGVELVNVDSVDIKFDKTDKFEVGQVLKFGTSNKEYKVKYIRNVSEQIPNPEYKPLTQLIVEAASETLHVDDVLNYTITTDAEDYTVEAENPSIVLVNKSLKTLTALKEGSTIVNFKATREGCRENIVSINLTVIAKEQTSLIVSPEQLNIIMGRQGTITVDTEAEDYTITSKNRAIATIEPDKRTINGVNVGSCLVELRAQAEGKLETVKTINVIVNERIETTLDITPEGPLAIDVGEKQIFNIETNGSWTMEHSQEADKEYISINKEEKSCTGLKEGSAVIKFSAIADGASEIEKLVTVNVNAVILPDLAGVSFDKEAISSTQEQGEQSINVTSPEGSSINTRVDDDTIATVLVESNLIKVTPLKVGATNINVTISKEGFNNFTKVIPVAISSTNPPSIDFSVNEIRSRVSNPVEVTLTLNDVESVDTIQTEIVSSDGFTADITNEELVYTINPTAEGTGTLRFTINKALYPELVKELPINVLSADANPNIELRINGEKPDNISTNVGAEATVIKYAGEASDSRDANFVSSDGMVVDLNVTDNATTVTPVNAGTGTLNFSFTKGEKTTEIVLPITITNSQTE